MSVTVFLLHFITFFGVGLPAYLINNNPFSKEHIFVGFNEFPSLVCWCIVIHYHRPQGPTLFQRVRWDFTCVQSDVYWSCVLVAFFLTPAMGNHSISIKYDGNVDFFQE